MTPESPTPTTSPILDYLTDLHHRHSAVSDGTVATYIPELAKADPNWFGICLVTSDGHLYEVGDSQQPFTIQSISKPFVYGLALEDNTRAEVLKKVGLEPTGDAFNAISLEPGTGRPMNPMINAGAIAAASLIAGKSERTRLARMLEMFSLYAGREIEIDEPVYRSESETGHRNRAIGHLLRNFDVLTEPPDKIVDLYFKQCSISVTCRDLGVMAATLANRGVNPLTGKRAIRGEYVENVLAVMGSCGMYNYAGEWLYRIGMPAKSGVSGGVIAVLPGQLGVGVFSPPLDDHGNSARGIRVCDDLSRHFDLHLFNTPHTTRSVIRLRFTAADIGSSRVRTPEEARLLREHGRTIQVYQLQGHLAFSTAEVVIRDVMENADAIEFLILDLKHAVGLNESACRLFHQLVVKFADLEKPVLFTHTDRFQQLRRYMRAKLGGRFDGLYVVFDDDDKALEWCENRVLGARRDPAAVSARITPADYDLFSGLTPAEIGVVAKLLERRKFAAGEVMVQFGAPADELFLLASGTASVTVTLSGGAQKRLATFSPGMAFGEMALLDRAPRSAVVTADSDVECDLLKAADFDRLADTHPRIQITLLRNLALGLSSKLRKANREISVFDY